MEQEISAEPLIPSAKIYKDAHFFGAAFLGGPVAGGYLMAQNYKVFGEPENVRKTWIWTIVATTIIFAIAFAIPAGNTSFNIALPLAYCAAGATLMKQLQGDRIKAYLEEGGSSYDWKRVLMVGLVAMGIMLAVIMAISLIAVIMGYQPKTA